MRYRLFHTLFYAQRPMHRATLLAWLLLIGWSLTIADAHGEDLISKEYQVKAVFLYNIPKFVEWPPSAFASSDDPLVLGVFGNSPFGDQLYSLVKDRKINGRSIAVKQVNSADDARSVQLLFVSASDARQFNAIKASLQGTPVLTVGESPDFAVVGGMINFVLIDDKVRFEINITAAERVGLRISAQLQKLASTIRRTP